MSPTSISGSPPEELFIQADFLVFKEIIKERAETLFHDLPPRMGHEQFVREKKLELGIDNIQLAFEAYRKQLEDQYLLKINKVFPLLNYSEVKYTFDALRQEGFLKRWKFHPNNTQLRLVGRVKQLPGGWIVPNLSQTQRQAPLFTLWQNENQLAPGSYRFTSTIHGPIFNNPHHTPGASMQAGHTSYHTYNNAIDSPTPVPDRQRRYLPPNTVGLAAPQKAFSPSNGRYSNPVVVRDPNTSATVNLQSSIIPEIYKVRERRPNILRPQLDGFDRFDDWYGDLHDVWPLEKVKAPARIDSESSLFPTAESLHSTPSGLERVIIYIDKTKPTTFNPRFRNTRARFEQQFNRIVAKKYHMSQLVVTSFQLYNIGQKLQFRADALRMVKENEADKSYRDKLQKTPHSSEWRKYCIEILKDSEDGQCDGKIWYSEERKMPVPFLKLAQMKGGKEPEVWCDNVFDEDAVRAYLCRVMGADNKSV